MEVVQNCCSKCGKECKDKRGVSIHEAKCGKTKAPICPHCNTEFSCLASLHNHLERCKIYKQQIIDREQKQKEDLIRQEYDKNINELKNQLLDLQKSFKTQLSTRETQLELSKKEKEEVIKDITEKWKQDVKVNNKLRDDDLNSMHKELQEYKIKTSKLESENAELKKKKENDDMNFRYDKNRLVDVIVELQKSKQYPQITNNQQNNVQQTVFQLQLLEPTIIQGRIKPPDMIVHDINELVSHLLKLGMRNYYRISDVSRGNAIWYKPGTGKVKDHKCKELANFIADTLTEEIRSQQAYYEQQLEYKLREIPNDQYVIDMLRDCIKFCNSICSKDDKSMFELGELLIKKGRAYSDTNIDFIQDITYIKLISSISNALFPKMTEWIEKTPYELGVYLSKYMSNYYHTEGGSREKLFIFIKDDNDNNHMVYSEHFQPILIQSAQDDFTQSKSVLTLIHLLTTKTNLNQDRVNEWIHYFSTPEESITKEIIRGIIR